MKFINRLRERSEKVINVFVSNRTLDKYQFCSLGWPQSPVARHKRISVTFVMKTERTPCGAVITKWRKFCNFGRRNMILYHVKEHTTSSTKRRLCLLINVLHNYFAAKKIKKFTPFLTIYTQLPPFVSDIRHLGEFTGF